MGFFDKIMNKVDDYKNDVAKYREEAEKFSAEELCRRFPSGLGARANAYNYVLKQKLRDIDDYDIMTIFDRIKRTQSTNQRIALNCVVSEMIRRDLAYRDENGKLHIRR